LVNFFLNRFAKKPGKRIDGVSRDTMDRLTNYAWPGNIRELQNVLERAVVLARSPIIKIDESVLPPVGPSKTSGTNTLEEIERAHILRVLEDFNWVIHGQRGAASTLGINPSTLRSRMQKLGIKKPQRTP
jgi:DNA-binding NtrC family response regulator